MADDPHDAKTPVDGDGIVDDVLPPIVSPEGTELTPLLMRADVGVTALLALGAGAVSIFMPDLVESGGIAYARNYSTLSASAIPQVSFGVLAVVAAIATYFAFVRLQTESGVAIEDEPQRLRRAATIFAIVVVYALTITWLGFILATMIASAVVALYLGLRNPIAFIPSVLVIPILIRFVFERLLLISLPRSHIESVGVIEDAVMRFLAQTVLG